MAPTWAVPGLFVEVLGTNSIFLLIEAGPSKLTFGLFFFERFV